MNTFVVTAALPAPRDKIYVPTRMVVGTEEQATDICRALEMCHIHAEFKQTDGIPERPQVEIDRAGQLMYLLYATPVGMTH